MKRGVVLQEALTSRQQQALQSRKKMLEAALQLFALHGYKKTSVHMICHSLGMADSLLYHYFPGGKKELMQSLLQEKLLLLLAELNSRNDALENLPLGDMLEKLYQGIEETVMRHRDLLRLVLRENLIEAMPLNDPLREMIRCRHLWFASLLEKQALRGEIAPMDYVSAAETLDSMMLFHLGLELIGVSEDPLADAARRKRLIAYQIDLWKRPNHTPESSRRDRI